MSRNLRAALLALVSLACTSAERGSAGATGPERSRSSEQVSWPGTGAPRTSPEVQASPPPEGGAQDPELEVLRGLLEQARQANEEQDHAGARERIAAAIERALSEIGDREDAAALELLNGMGSFAQDCGELRWAEKARRRVLEVRLRTLPTDHPDLQWARGNLAITMYALGDLPGARALEEQVLEVRSRTLPPDHPDLQAARQSLAATMYALGDLSGARGLVEQVLEVRSRTLPADHPDLQAARGNLAGTMYELGDLHGARVLFEQVLEVHSRTLPADHPDLQLARQNLAATIASLGDLPGARALQEQVLEVRSRTLPADHRDLHLARLGLAVTIKALGDLHGARALEEQVLEVCSRTLPVDHPDLQKAQGNLATTIKALGDLPGARALEEQVLEVRSRTLPVDHPDLQKARGNLAITIKVLGDLPGARALEEQVLEVRSRTLPPDHPDLQKARANLAITIKALGDLPGARALQEQVLEVCSRTLPADHPDLQKARANLAITIKALGDLPGARALQEQVLEVRSRTLPPDHPDLQAARLGIASSMYALGDLPGARALQEQVLEVSSRTLPPDHPDLQLAWGNLAATIKALGDLPGARALQEQVLEVRSRTLPEDHPDLQAARGNLAATMYALGDLHGARALFEQVLEVCSRTLPADHPALQNARVNLAWTVACQHARSGRSPGGEGEKDEESEGGRERCAELVGALCLAQTSAARAALLGGSAREAEARCETHSKSLDTSLSFAGGLGLFEPMLELERASFILSETTRGAASGSAALTRRAAGTPRYSELREELRQRNGELASLVQKGATSESFRQALASREAVEQELAELARELSGGEAIGLDFDLDALAVGLGERDAVVAYRRYQRSSIASPEQDDVTAYGSPSTGEAPIEKTVDSLCAFVVRSRGRAVLTCVELGPIEPIEDAVRAWRASLGVALDARGVAVSETPQAAGGSRERGTELRRLAFAPLLPALAGAEHAVFVLDDVLHLVPFDALPAAEARASPDAGSRLGDRLRIETRVTVAELLAPADRREDAGLLVVLGGVAYDRAEAATADAPGDVKTVAALRGDAEAGILRGGAWSGGFADLPGTREEVQGIAHAFEGRPTAGAGVTLLEGIHATRERLLELAPQARWLHVATHGWFASESVRSWKDPEPLDKHSGLGMRLSGEEQVKGMSPMLLCGLALAGANLPEDELGRVPGLITAEEISALDLSSCELAVLSACDTNVGERRAGQGVASLQKALQMAGARSVITSLWKVPDDATRELMVDFYRRIWVERKPKAQALWEAKRKLRDARDEAGHPRYTTRDWGAWVLTGEPD